ncbi:MAG: energy transducer TonB [Ignavibacteriaceae bacterium]|nr:energy transducer TonB [Ignavibacteriaceae bacterium]
MPDIKNFKVNLRAKYGRYIKLSIIFMLAIFIAAFKFSPQSVIPEPIPIDSTIWITVEDIESTIQKPKPPPPPQPEPVLANLDEVPEEIERDETDLDENAHVDFPPPPPDPPANDENEIIDFLPSEDQPKPIGGLISILEKVYYTEIAKRAGIEGTVVIQAVVDKQGNIIDAFVKKSLGGGLDEIALDAVKNTKFHPGKQRGKPVNVRISIPIKFVLK